MHYGLPLVLYSQHDKKLSHGLDVDDNAMVACIRTEEAQRGKTEKTQPRMDLCNRLYRKVEVYPKPTKSVRHLIGGGCVWVAKIFGMRGHISDKIERRWFNIFVVIVAAESRHSQAG